jgi:hypothetical protein
MQDDEKPQTDPKQVEEFIATARDRFDRAMTDEKPLRDEYSINQRFVAGEQWDDKLKEARIKAGRPVLTFPRCHTFVQKVSNEARQNKTKTSFSPAEDGDKETAEIYEGLTRHIWYSSDGQVAIEHSVECSAGGSFGYFRFLTDYCDDESDDQELIVKPVFDPLSVYGVLMPACYGQDPSFAFVVEEIPKADYIAAYGETHLAKNWDEASQQYSGWVGTETVRIAEYWYVEEKREKNKKGRMVTRRTVKFCKINGVEVLPDSETEWVGDLIPIIPVLGKLIFVDGKPRLFSVVSHQRGSQQLINLGKSRIAETLAIAPVSPFIAAKGQLEGLESEWRNINGALGPIPSVLQYNPIDLNGKPAPPPQRQTFEPPIGALTESVNQEIDGMKASAGIFDASLGSKGNETSGIAIQRRQQESDDVNMHIIDNLARACIMAGKRVVAPALPIIYDTPRQVRILGEDEAPKIVKINQAYQEGDKTKHYKIGGEGVGKYDVVVTMGRSFSTKRMESYDLYVQLQQANPQAFFPITDLMLRNSDMAGADEAAERMKKVIALQFPGIIEDEAEEGSPEQLKAQLVQTQQQNQQLTQALNEATDAVEKDKAKTESAERIAAEKNQTQLMLEQMRQEFEARRQDDQQQHEAAMEALRADLAEIQAAIGHDRTLEVQANQPEPRQEA